MPCFIVLQPLEFLEILPGQPDYIFKVLVVGNSYVGKSSFLMQLCNHSFSQRYSSTIGKCVCVCLCVLGFLILASSSV